MEELANHVGHVRREHEEEQAEAHSTEVFPQTPGQVIRGSYSQSVHTLLPHHRGEGTMAAPDFWSHSQWARVFSWLLPLTVATGVLLLL